MHLGRFLSNIGGPAVKARRLYTEVIKSMILYGAPIWANYITKEKDKALRRIRRRMTIRIMKAYRTISHDAALILASMTPFSTLAKVDAKIFYQVRLTRDNEETIPRM